MGRVVKERIAILLRFAYTRIPGAAMPGRDNRSLFLVVPHDRTDSACTNLSQQFVRDNYSGICPEASAAMETANHGHAVAHGDAGPGLRCLPRVV